MSEGEQISISNGELEVPNNPVIHFIQGDGIGIDITPVMIDVVDSSCLLYTSPSPRDRG